MPECPVCEELLVQYIAAGNEVIDRRKHLEHRPLGADREEASVLFERAMRQRTQFSRTLRRHQKQHSSV